MISTSALLYHSQCSQCVGPNAKSDSSRYYRDKSHHPQGTRLQTIRTNFFHEPRRYGYSQGLQYPPGQKTSFHLF
jgi:hypothetical protein